MSSNGAKFGLILLGILLLWIAVVGKPGRLMAAFVKPSALTSSGGS